MLNGGNKKNETEFVDFKQNILMVKEKSCLVFNVIKNKISNIFFKYTRIPVKIFK